MNLLGLDSNLSLLAAAYDSAPGIMRLLELSSQTLQDLFGWAPEATEPWLAVILPLIGILIMLGPIVTIFPMFAIWLERKVSAHMQSRLGPMEIGWHGFLQTVADGVKLLAKEDIIPAVADKALFILGPILAFTGIFVLLVTVPFGPYLSVSDLHLGLIFIAAVGSLEVVGVLMAGWGSNNKWSLFGTMRLATQLVSYEIPLGLSFLTVILVAGSFQLGAIAGQWDVQRYDRIDPTTNMTATYTAPVLKNYAQSAKQELIGKNPNLSEPEIDLMVKEAVSKQFGGFAYRVLQGLKGKAELDTETTYPVAYSGEEVKEYRKYVEKQAREGYQRDRAKAEFKEVVAHLRSGNHLIPKTDGLKDWHQLFVPSYESFTIKKTGETLSFEAAMKSVEEMKMGEILAGQSLSQPDLLKLVMHKLEEKHGALEAGKVVRRPAEFYAFDGHRYPASEVNSWFANVMSGESADERALTVLKSRLGERYGNIRSVGVQRGQSGWVFNWYVFRNPFMLLMLIIFFTASLAENKRAPFDLPEAESELVSGFHTEYSGMRFSIFFLAEYVAMFVVSLLAALLFLGGWNTGIAPIDNIHVVSDPVLEGSSMVACLKGIGASPLRVIGHVVIGHATIMIKTVIFVFIQMWLRWTLPRVRLDHVMDVCLKVLLPFSLAGLVLVAVWELLASEYVIFQYSRYAVTGVGFLLFFGWVGWFWTSFQAPLNESMKEKPWDTSGAFLK